LAEDPGETTDISAQNPEKVLELKNILNEKLMGSGAKFPVKNEILKQ